MTRDTQGPPLRRDRVQRQPWGEALRGVIHGCTGVAGAGGQACTLTCGCAHSYAHPDGR